MIALVVTIVGACLVLLAGLLLFVCLQRLLRLGIRSVMAGRGEQLEPLILAALLDDAPEEQAQAQSLLVARSSGLINAYVTEKILLRFADELRGADRAAVTAVAEATGTIDALRRRLRSPWWWVRLSTARGLERARSLAALPELLRAARDRHSMVRLAALRALGRLEDTAAREALFAALDDPEVAV